MDEEMDDPAFIAAVEGIATKIGPLLTGHPPQIQGAVLGQLVAIWLGGYYAHDPDEQMELWTSLLTEQAKLSLRLVASDRKRRQAG